MDFYLFNPSSVHLKNNSPYLGEIYCLVTILIMLGLDLRTLCQVLSPNYFLKSMDLGIRVKNEVRQNRIQLRRCKENPKCQVSDATRTGIKRAEDQKV